MKVVIINVNEEVTVKVVDEEGNETEYTKSSKSTRAKKKEEEAEQED